MPEAQDHSASRASNASVRDLLLASLARGVLAVDGVVALEPTLSTAGPGVVWRRDPADGIRVTNRADVVEVDVNVATSAERSARTVAHDIQACVAAVLSGQGQTPGSVTVSVLRIDATSADRTDGRGQS